MSYSVCAYLIEADKVRSVYGACDNQLINQLKVALKQELDSLNDSFSNWKIQCKLPPKTKRFCPLVLK